MNDLLKTRFSPYEFDPSYELDENQIKELFEAARWAPSSYNEQPWQFFYATRQNNNGFKKLYDLILDGNKPWSGEVSMLVIGVANNTFTRNGKPNKHASYDLGQAVMSLTIQATEMGLNVHQMGGFDAQKAKDVFNLANNQDAIVAVAIGKSFVDGNSKRTRKSIEEIFIEA
ncbi:MAG: nitroreductase family protein [Bacteroidia bacterium]